MLPTTPLHDVDDGYTEEIKINSVTVRFRPITGRYRDRLFESFKGRSDREVADAVLKHVVSGFRAALSRGPEFLIKEVCHLSKREQDEADAANLAEGVWLELHHPEVANRPCELCRTWWYQQDGTIYRRRGQMQKRIPGTLLPCETEEGCPKGTPDSPRSLSPKNRLAWEHFLDCDAICSFPDDPVVKANARIIRKCLTSRT